jgi:hypothetical protein
MPECRHHKICGLTDEADPAAGLCILHSLQVDKDPALFTNALKEHRGNRRDRFAYMVFPMETDFSKAAFNYTEGADFSEATFTAKADFSEATFAGMADFSEATFTAGATFAGATFTAGADFGNTTFTKQADFISATFRSWARFRLAKFSERLNLTRVTFKAMVDFSGATFCGRLSCPSTTFAEHADFNEATFTRADFNVTTFAGKTYFNKAIFKEEANFFRATFKEEANFFRTTFTGEAKFEAANFTSGVDFRETTFAARAAFHETTFSGRAHFLDTTFAAGADFRGAQFRGRTLFTGPQAAETHQFDFRDLVIESPDSLCFRHMDFRTCRFLNTDLRKIELTGVRWPENPGRWRKKGTRHAVYDEIFCKQQEQPLPWDELERLYRELKQNYDDRRNYPRAGDFHYGEKEMQRRNPATPWTLKVFLWLYRLVSGYGERLLRPLLCALVLLIGGTVAYLLCGLVPKAPFLSTRPETTAFVVMPGAVSRPAPLPLTQLNAWLCALHYSFRVMTLLKPEDLEPIGFAKVVQTLQSLLGPLFLGLFALAVRQRLKH